MKRILSIILLLASFACAKGQFFENNALYLSSGLNLGNYWGGTIGLNYVYKEKYALQFNYSGNQRKSKNIPSDYSTGIFNVFFLGLDQPHDYLESYNLLAGRVYKLNSRGSLRLNVAAGFGYTEIKEPKDWEEMKINIYGVPLTNTHDWEETKDSRASFIMNPRLEFTLNPYLGAYFAGQLIANEKRTFIGAEVGILLGVLRARK